VKGIRGTVTLDDREIEADIQAEEDYIAVTFDPLTINKHQTLKISVSTADES